MSRGIYYLLCSVIAVAYFDQAFGGSSEPASFVETYYKQGQEYVQNLVKQLKDGGYYIKEFDDEKTFGPIKGYIQKASDSIYESAKKLEKEAKPYYGEEFQKQIITLQKQVEELSKQLRKKEYYEKVEKLHDSYVESLRKISDQIYEVAKTSPVKDYVPEKVQYYIKQLFEEFNSASKKLHIKISEAITEAKKKAI